MSGVAKILRAYQEPNGNYMNWRIVVPRKDGQGEFTYKMVDDTAGQNAQALEGQLGFIMEQEQMSKAGKPYKKVVAVHPANNAQDPNPAPPPTSQEPAYPQRDNPPMKASQMAQVSPAPAP